MNIDSPVPNHVVLEGLLAGSIQEIQAAEKVRKEVAMESLDLIFILNRVQKKSFIEVKGVTLESEGIVMFPDAPTARGTKHVYEMINAVQAGYGGYIFFLSK